MADPFVEETQASPGGSVPVLVDHHEESEFEKLVADGVPTQVAEVFAGLHRVGRFWAIPIVQGEDGIEMRAPRVENRIPTENEIGQQFGAVKYCIEFEFQRANWKKGIDRKATPWLQLASVYQDIHEEWKEKRLLEREERERARTTLRHARNGVSQPTGFGVKEIVEALPAIVAVIQALRPAPPPPPPPPADNTPLLLGVLQLMQSTMAAGSNQAAELTKTLLSKSDKDREQMMMFLTHNAQSKDQSSNQMVEKVLDLIGSAKQIKGAVREIVEDDVREPQETSLVDKLIAGAGILLEKLPAMLPMGTKQVLVDTTMPQSHPEAYAAVQRARVDDELRANAIMGIVPKYGCKQAREVLLAASMPVTEDDLKKACELTQTEYEAP